MIGFTDIQTMIADGFLNGDMTTAGLLMFVSVLGIVFAITRNIFHSLILGLPMVLIFATLGIVSTDMTILLIIITVLGLAITSTKTFDRKG